MANASEPKPIPTPVRNVNSLDTSDEFAEPDADTIPAGFEEPASVA